MATTDEARGFGWWAAWVVFFTGFWVLALAASLWDGTSMHEAAVVLLAGMYTATVIDGVWFR